MCAISVFMGVVSPKTLTPCALFTACNNTHWNYNPRPAHQRRALF